VEKPTCAYRAAARYRARPRRRHLPNPEKIACPTTGPTLARMQFLQWITCTSGREGKALDAERSTGRRASHSKIPTRDEYAVTRYGVLHVPAAADAPAEAVEVPAEDLTPGGTRRISGVTRRAQSSWLQTMEDKTSRTSAFMDEPSEKVARPGASLDDLLGSTAQDHSMDASSDGRAEPSEKTAATSADGEGVAAAANADDEASAGRFVRSKSSVRDMVAQWEKQG
jgi:hypothetical protein